MSKDTAPPASVPHNGGTVWVLTDGKAGDEMPLIGVADALELPFEVRRVRPRRPWVWLLPYGPIDPKEKPDRPGSPLAPPFPAICLATGRRAIAYARFLKRQCGCFIVLFKDPRTAIGFADLVFVQQHDQLRGANVVVTLTGPNRITTERLSPLRDNPAPLVAALPKPRAAVLIGGDTKRFKYTENDARRLVGELEKLASSEVSLMITASRRTPPYLAAKLAELADRSNVVLWDGTGANPYFGFLANADMVIVTADSTNMVGEAAATGRPVYIFRPERQDRRFDPLLEGLSEQGIAWRFPGPLVGERYSPLNETAAIAATILERCKKHR